MRKSQRPRYDKSSSDLTGPSRNRTRISDLIRGPRILFSLLLKNPPKNKAKKRRKRENKIAWAKGRRRGDSRGDPPHDEARLEKSARRGNRSPVVSSDRPFISSPFSFHLSVLAEEREREREGEGEGEVGGERRAVVGLSWDEYE